MINILKHYISATSDSQGGRNKGRLCTSKSIKHSNDTNNIKTLNTKLILDIK